MSLTFESRQRWTVEDPLTQPNSYTYCFFGTGFDINRPLAGVGTGTARGVAAIRVLMSRTATRHFEGAAGEPLYRSSDRGSDDSATLAIDALGTGEFIRIRYGDGTLFVVDRSGSEIHASWTSSSTPEDVEIYLLGPIAGLLLYLRGVTCLHASAIADHDRALVYVGAAEAGKSTIAAAFARLGHRVLTDDILALDNSTGCVTAQPGVPRIGLWPDSVLHLLGNADALPRQTRNWDKRYLDLVAQDLYQDSPLPIGAVYLLADRQPATEFRIEPVVGTEAVLALIANKYVTRYSERHQDKHDFVLLSELTESVPVRRVMRNDRLPDLHATCEAILSDYASLRLALT